MIPGPVPAADWLIVAPVVLMLIVGALLLMMRKRTDWQAGIAIAALAVNLVICANLVLKVAAQGTVVMTMGRWLPPFGITFAVDMLGALFALAAGIVGAVRARSMRCSDIERTRAGATASIPSCC